MVVRLKDGSVYEVLAITGDRFVLDIQSESTLIRWVTCEEVEGISVL